MKTVAIIPVIPSFNNLLSLYLKKPIIDHVIGNILKMKFIDKIVLVTQDKNIESYVKENHSKICIANVFGCRYGTEMLFQYYLRDQKYNNYLLFPNNDPNIDSLEISKLWRTMPKPVDEISTLYTKFFCFEDLNRSWSRKIITNSNDYLMYTSRSIIPVNESGEYVSLHHYKKHIGVYLFHKELLLKQGKSIWGKWVSPSERITQLEENRFIDLGIKIKTHRINHIGFEINSSAQIKILETRIISGGKQSGYSSSPMQQLSENRN